MNRVRLCCRIDGKIAWALVDRLEAQGAQGVTLLPLETDERLYEPEPGTVPLPSGLTSGLLVEALFDSRADAEAAAAAAGVADRCGYEPLPERDWVAEGERGFSPQRFGERLWIVPEWSEVPDFEAVPGAVNVVIAPGLAFGTGTHPSTALCLEWLANADLKGCSVIDYGCGSGVLAVAAARLGARQVCAVDNDPQALMATRANAERNDVAVAACAPEDAGAQKADVLVANILARPLVALAGELCSRTRVGGRIVLAGITTGQADVVVAAYLPQAREVRRFQHDEWLCLELLRSGAESE